MRRLLVDRTGISERLAWNAFAIAVLMLLAVMLLGLGMRAPIWSVDLEVMEISGTSRALGDTVPGMALTGAILAVASLMYLVCLRALWRGFRHSLAAAVACSILGFAVMLPAAPLSSPDAVHLAADARTLWLHGVYPAQSGGAPSNFDDPVNNQVVAYRDKPSGYGPLAYVIAGAPLPFAGDTLRANVFGQKVVGGLFALASALLAGLLATKTGRDPALVIGAIGLHPLVLWEFAGGGHNDSIMVTFGLLAAVAVVSVSRSVRGAGVAAGVASVLCKLGLAVAAPLVLAYWFPRWRTVIAILTIVGGLGVVIALNSALGLPARGPARAVSLLTFWGAISDWFGFSGVVVDLTWVMFVFFAALVVSDHPLATPRDFVTAVALLVFTFLFAALPGVHPWYYLWFLPFVAVSGRPWLVAPALVLTLGSFVPTLLVNWSPALADEFGVSNAHEAAAVMLWLAVAAVMVVTWRGSERPTAARPATRAERRRERRQGLRARA